MAPNRFTAVMGTGIIANGIALLWPAAVNVAVAFWVAATALLLVLLRSARRLTADPAMLPFYGAVPMAILTVGAGARLEGHVLLGDHAALLLDIALWGIGTVLGLAVAVTVPRLTWPQLELAQATGTWLLPVVPPIVSAAAGAGLVGHVPGVRAVCVAELIVALSVALPIVALVIRRVLVAGVGAAAAVPAYWILLGPLGTSATAANLLSDSATARAYGTAALAVALCWLVVAIALTVRARPPFSMAWWAFTFPVGTCVTASAVLARHTSGFTVVGALLLALLLAGWSAAAVGTLRYP